MKIKAFKLNSFAKKSGGGNPAGIVLEADFLSDEEMKRIAEKLGFSETAFISKSNLADFKLRFFTPNDEVNLCGHATVGSYFTLFKQGIIASGVYTQEVKAGILEIEVNQNGIVTMEQNCPTYYDILNNEEIASSLSIGTNEIIEELPIQIVSTGLKDIIIPVKSLDIINKISPNLDRIKHISKKYGVIGYHVFTLETLHNASAHCRNFAPLYGINEESATGTSNGALACYLYKYGEVKDMENIVMEQGYSMNRPSEIHVKLSSENDKIKKVMVGGKALDLQEIEVEL